MPLHVGVEELGHLLGGRIWEEGLGLFFIMCNLSMKGEVSDYIPFVFLDVDRDAKMLTLGSTCGLGCCGKLENGW